MNTLRGFVLAAVLTPFAPAAAPGWVQAGFLESLPGGAAVRGVALDSEGNILIAGYIGTVAAGVYSSEAFVARYAPDAQTQLSYLSFPNSSAGPIVTDDAGNAYIAGTTTSDDFPTTAGAFQRTRGPQGSGFIVKLDRNGKAVYSTLFGGPSGNPYPAAIAVNQAGEAFVTGQNGGNLPVSEGGISIAGGTGQFVLRLSAAGDHTIYSAVGVGGSGIAIDADNNAYVVSGSYDPAQVPVTNAIQKTVPFTICYSNRAFAFPCSHQNVAKIDAGGTRILFSTYVSGTYGESAGSIAVDSHGDVYLAGTTNSTDYPVTANALQPRNLAGIPPPPVYHDFFSQGSYSVYPATGYITKLAGDGSRILYSTYLGGTRNDAAFHLTVDPQGEVTIAMRIQSPDFPALPSLPLRCLPDRLHDLPVLVRLNAAGNAIRSTTVVEGVAPGSGVVAGYDRAGGAVLAGDGTYLARIDSGISAPSPLVCMTDAADYVQTGALSPGQLVTLFGNGLGTTEPASYDPSASALPRELGGAIVLVNGVAAPMMYASAEQINFVVPYEIVGRQSVPFELITASGEHVRRMLRVAGSSPSLITLGENDYPTCGGKTVEGSIAAVVSNPDGTRNSCASPARAGDVVSVFLSGAGTVEPAITGLNQAAAMPLHADVADGYGNEVQGAFAVPWAPLGVWQVNVKLNPPFSAAFGVSSATAIQLQINGVPVRESPVPVWLCP